MLYKDQIISLGDCNVKQVNKNAAEKAFEEGKRLFFHASGTPLNGIYGRPVEITKIGDNTFEKYVNAFLYYNREGRLLFFVEA